MGNIKFIFMDVQNSISAQYIMKDIIDHPNVIYLKTHKNIGNGILSKIFRKLKNLYTIDMWFSKLFSFMKNICEKGYQLDDIKFDDNTKYYIIFVDAALVSFSKEYIKKLTSKTVKPLLLLLNAIDTIPKYSFNKIGCFENMAFSVYREDCKKYGYKYTHNIYSKLIENDSFDITKDLYYIGDAKDRFDEIIGVYEQVEKDSIKTDFNIVKVETDRQKYTDKINYCNFIPYPDTLREMLKCNCILEVLDTGENDSQTRYHEAVCYNKKFLTNNKSVVTLPFYNPEYMKVFEKPEDIDCEWVKERIPIDYGYDGRFSPVHLLDKIVELDNKKEGLERG